MKKTKSVSYTKNVVIIDETKKPRSKPTDPYGRKPKLRRWFFFTLSILAALFLLIYLFFIPESCLIAGNNLTKSDWLNFLGSYISLSASVCIAVITIYQTRYYQQLDNARRKDDRDKEIKPAFSIEFLPIDKDPDSFTIRLQNVGKYPIRNVAVCDIFMFQLMAIEAAHEVPFSYSGNTRHHLLHSEYAQDDVSGYPKELSINYDDVDGTCWTQYFVLRHYGNSSAPQYHLIKTEEHYRE